MSILLAELNGKKILPTYLKFRLPILLSELTIPAFAEIAGHRKVISIALFWLLLIY
ncbi:hypothetical protein FDUTEX481_07975 [Tolypothrix sp. PCC 7601]|nr:hypothetical protein FDUTEX481_07975 [Tolypothrix sp. PCC 7601]